MNPSRINFRKALLWMGGWFFVGLMVLFFAPANIEGIYGERDAQGMCGHREYLRFYDGKVLCYNTGHPPAGWVGTYQRESDGTVTVEQFGIGETMRLNPRIFYMRMDAPKFGWDFRAFPTKEIKDAIATHQIEKAFVSASGEREVEVYDSDFNFIERKLVTEP